MKKAIITTGKILAFFLLWVLSFSFIQIPTSDPAIWRLEAEVIPFLPLIPLSFIFWLIEKKNLQIIPCKRPLFTFLSSVITGALWVGFPLFILHISKNLFFDGVNTVPFLEVWIIACIFNVIMQELLVRGYIYQLLKKNYNVVTAILFSTTIFTLLHLPNFQYGLIPLFNVITMSLFMSLALEYTGSFLAPVLLHSIWNCICGVILGTISLASDYPHLLNFSISGNPLLSGGVLQFEGSMIVLLVNVIFCVMLLLLLRKKRLKSI